MKQSGKDYMMNKRVERNHVNTKRGREVLSSGEARKSHAQLVKEREARKRAKALRKKRKRIKLLVQTTVYGGIALLFVLLAIALFYRNPIEKGSNLLEKGKYEEAIHEYMNALNDLKYMPQAYQGMGLAYYELEDYQETIKCLQLAVQKGISDSGTIYNILSIAQMIEGEYEEAIVNIVKALEQTGNSAELIRQLKFNEVVCLERLAQWDGAKAKATAYLQSYPDDDSMHQEIFFLQTR